MPINYYIIDTGSVNASGEKIFYIAMGEPPYQIPITEPMGKSAFKSTYRTKLSNLATAIFNL